MTYAVTGYKPEYRSQIVALSLRAWEPVFTALQPAVQPYVYDAFFPNGWADRQANDVEQVLSEEAGNVWVAAEDGVVLGWIGIRLHPLDQMGEVRIIAVDPAHQRRGIATALLDFALDFIRQSGMKMVMVETGGDPGHAPARATYERAGFDRWPVARYFRKL